MTQLTNHATATPVTVHQSRPLAVEVWPSGIDTVLRILVAALAVLHAVSCVVFLYTMWVIYQGLADLQQQLQQWGGGLGG